MSFPLKFGDELVRARVRDCRFESAVPTDHDRWRVASLLLKDGAPITQVSQQLGHKNASITLRVYTAGPIRLLARERSRALIHDQISATVPYRIAFRTGAANQSVTRNGGHVIASTVEDCGAVKNTKANATHTAPTRNPAAVARPIDRFIITTLR